MRTAGSFTRTSGICTPRTGYNLKANFDGVLKSEENRGGIGVVVRKSKGEVTGAKSAGIFGVDDPFLVEAEAMISAIKLALELGFYRS